MLTALNHRVEAGENVPPHVLKYAWNMASFTRLRISADPSSLPGDDEIREVFSVFDPGRPIPRREIYAAYCRHSTHPLSARSFWPRARELYNLTDIRRPDGRIVIINL